MYKDVTRLIVDYAPQVFSDQKNKEHLYQRLDIHLYGKVRSFARPVLGKHMSSSD